MLLSLALIFENITATSHEFQLETCFTHKLCFVYFTVYALSTFINDFSFIFQDRANYSCLKSLVLQVSLNTLFCYLVGLSVNIRSYYLMMYNIPMHPSRNEPQGYLTDTTAPLTLIPITFKV